MAGKITIRRVGSVLPTICLLLFLILCVGVVWLSTQGVPASALRYIERKAAAQGVALQIDSVKLYPSRGLALRAEGVRLYEKAGDAEPLATLPHVTFGIIASDLLVGKVTPRFFLLNRGELRVPVTSPAGEYLHVSDITFSARKGPGGIAELSSGRLNFQGISVEVKGSLDLAAIRNGVKSADSQSSQPLNLSRLREEHQDVINKVYDYITEQKWSSAEMPSVDIRADIGEERRIALKGNVPRLELKGFHFRTLAFDLLYHNKILVINDLRVKTVDPDTSARFQGGYDVEGRHLSFAMDSTVDLLRLIRRLSEGDVHKHLAKFRHAKDCPPHIELKGDINLEENYSPESVHLSGSLLQKEMSIGTTKVDEISLSFSYDNGNFNISKLDLLLPDGHLKISGGTKNGEGKVTLDLDLPVEQALTLAGEVLLRPISLPQGLELGERVNSHIDAKLTVPTFTPGETHWQGYVPAIHELDIALHSGYLAYQGYQFEAPELRLTIAGIQRDNTVLPQALDHVFLSVKGQKFSLSSDDHKLLKLNSPDMKLHLYGVKNGDDGVPRSLEKVTLSVDTQDAVLDSERPASLRGAALAVTLNEVTSGEDGVPRQIEATAVEFSSEQVMLGEEPTLDLRMPKMSLKMGRTGIDQALSLQSLCTEISSLDIWAESVVRGGTQVRTPELHLKDVKEFMPFAEAGKLLSAAHLEATVGSLTQGESQVGSLELICDLKERTKGSISLKVKQEDGTESCSLTATPDWTDPQLLSLQNIDITLRAATLTTALGLLGIEMNEVEAPDSIMLKGACELDRRSHSLHAAQLHVAIPELVRTPQRQKVFEGKRIPIGIQADATLRQKQKDLLYDIALEVTHGENAFRGRIDGSSAGRVHVTGSNTILPNIVDMLIDNEDAHEIIRDFRFPEHAKVTISDIDVTVDYADGVRVDSDCHVELENTEYLISVIEALEGGSERVRRDLGPDPYTLVKHGSCNVLVNVRLNCRGADGSPMPDESVITIAKPVLEYNNTPWIRRQKWKSGTANTWLMGDAVIIDIERSFVEIRNIKGTVYPAYSLGMFYPSLQHYMEDVLLPHPVQIETPQCVFPIYSDCKRPMSGTIRVISPQKAGFRFLGTTIPLEDFSGFISLSDQYVLLDRMNAKCWEGVLDAAVKIGITGKTTSFDGYAKAQCMNLQMIAAAYGSKQAPALCKADIRFRSPSAKLTDIKAYGEISIENGDLMTLRIFQPVSDLISDLPGHLTRLEQSVVSTVEKKAATSTEAAEAKPSPSFAGRLFSGVFHFLGKWMNKTGGNITKTASNVPGMNHLIAYDLQEAFTKFDIINGHFITRGMKAKGYNLNIHLNLDINLDTMELRGNLWPRISSLPTLILAPLTFLSDFMLDIIIYGSVDDIKWRIGLDRRKPGDPPSATSEPSEKAPKKR